MFDHPFLREDIRKQLSSVLDVERLVAKVSTNRASPRDLLGLAGSLKVVKPLRERLCDVLFHRLGRSLRALGSP